MAFETILFERSDDGVATVTLNRPDRLNAFNRRMGEDFVQVWRQVREDEDVRAIVLRAAGERAFCTGSDQKEGGWRPLGGPFDHEDPGLALGPKQNRVWKPFICAVSGMAAGGAFYWLNEADIVICSEDATFFDPHVTFGKVAAVEATGLLGRIHYGEIMRMSLLGNDERITAPTALRIGLVTEVTPRGELWRRAHEIAAIIAAKPAVATQGSVRALWEGRSLPAALAVRNALKYTQLGNAAGEAQVDRAAVPKARWTQR